MERDLELDRTAVAALAGGFGGRVILPGDPDYDQARAGWNAIFDRYPACIARCGSVQDIVTAGRFAPQAKTPIRHSGPRGSPHRIILPASCLPAGPRGNPS